MRIFIIISALFVFSLRSQSQVMINIDSLTEKMCTTFKTEKLDNDSLRVMNMFSKHLTSYASKLTEQELDSIFSKCFFRLQLSCNEFKIALEQQDINKGDFSAVDTLLQSLATQNECSAFFKTQKFMYLEPTGDTTHVLMTKNSWTDHFKDGTISRLSLVRTNDYDFELTFIESTNFTRKNLSNAGDKYHYRILEKKENYYIMLLSIPGNSRRYKFKMYF
ncbi:hypothetical protein [Lacibacter sp.]|uniref:hypothetical protein n=1 Tax=Lacibacter sp. TaxID=1915409 RepID=UPI002B4B1835|nr:hypothetical protein [Lacibacter sp.]HLP39803.1 hypothetical protein [Lacibacter sp.]